MNRYARPEVAPDLDLAVAVAAAVARQGSHHHAVAVAAGPLLCPTCSQPWPCPTLRKEYPKAGG